MSFGGSRNWREFGATDLREIEKEATYRQGYPWVRKAWVWVLQRRGDVEAMCHPSLEGERAEGPPETLFPILGARKARQQGILGFLEQAESGGSPQRAILDALENCLAPVFPGMSMPVFKRCIAWESDGDSDDLAALIAALCHLFDLKHGHRIAATGSFKDGALCPVSADTLGAKLGVARDFGYQRVLVPEGQLGVPSDCQGFVVEVPQKLELALPALLEHVAGTQFAGEALAALLSVFDRGSVRADTDAGVSAKTSREVLHALERYCGESYPNLVRHVAHDIRSRVFLHSGSTQEADQEHEAAERVVPDYYPDSGWLRDYLLWHRHAHRLVVEVDCGRWDLNGEAFRASESWASHAAQTRTRSSTFAQLCIRNAQARMMDFVGRIQESEELLREAIHRYLSFQARWPELLSHSQKLGLGDSNLRRQENQVMEPLTALVALRGRIDVEEWKGISFWPDKGFDPQHTGAFDLVAGFRWLAVTQPQRADDMVEAVMDRLRIHERRHDFPLYQCYETILRFQPGSQVHLEEAVEALQEAYRHLLESPLGSILRILALRARALLAQVLPASEFPAPEAPGGPLAWIHKALLDPPFPRIVRRCPY